MVYIEVGCDLFYISNKFGIFVMVLKRNGIIERMEGGFYVLLIFLLEIYSQIVFCLF